MNKKKIILSCENEFKVVKMVNLGERIKYIRETYDLTQIELGNILNVSPSSIAHYEKNDWFIPMRNLYKMANYLNLSIDYILGFTNIKRYDKTINEINLQEIAKRIKEICDDQKFSNVKLAKELNSSESNIRNYKTGKYLILTPFVLQLALKYNYSTDWIVGRSENKYVDTENVKSVVTSK